MTMETDTQTSTPTEAQIETPPAPQTTLELKPAAMLDPVARLSEILFGLLMVLTFTGSFNAFEAGEAEVHELLIAGLGCNIAWGMIDGIVYYITTLAERGRNLRLLHKLKGMAPKEAKANSLLRDALPTLFSQGTSDEELAEIHQRLMAVNTYEGKLRPTWRELRNGIAVFLLVFLSTFPVIAPFLYWQDPVLALRVSHAIAILMLAGIGQGLARYAGSQRPWLVGALFAVFGVVIVLVTIALGG